MRKLVCVAIFALCSLPAFASGTFVQECHNSNGQFAATTTVACTLTGVAANHLIIAWGHSCIANGCGNVGTQATHAMSDNQVNSYTNVLNTLFTDSSQAGTRDRMTIWWEETGATAGNYTVTLTLNTASGNDIEVQEWSGLATSSPISGTPVSTQGFHSAGGSPPIVFTGGTITINGTANVATVLGNANGASDYLAMFVGFKALSGLDLLYLFGDCNNCSGTFQNVPAGYTKIVGSLGQDGNDVFMYIPALPGTAAIRKKGWIF